MRVLLIMILYMCICFSNEIIAQENTSGNITTDSISTNLTEDTDTGNNTFQDPSTLVIPPSPTAGGLGKYGDIPVSLATGVPNINIPLHNLQHGPINVPISMSYHASGIKVDEIASWVGLGWSLNAGGVVTRTVRGRKDEIQNGFLELGQEVEDFLAIPTDTEENFDFLDFIVRGYKDSEPDIFSFNFGNYTGQFIFDNNGEILITPNKNLEIEVLNGFGGFKITTPDGLVYLFTEEEKTRISNYGNQPSTDVYTSSWYLSQIYSNASPNYVVNFSYTSSTIDQQVSKVQTEIRQDAIINYNDYSNPPIFNGTFHNTVQQADARVQSLKVYTKRLDKITSPYESIELLKGNPREDLSGDNELDGIRVRRGGETIRYFDFEYGYFSSGNDEYEKRLRLESIQEKSTDAIVLGGRFNPPHTFEYNTTALPRRLSYNQDYWGYSNGANNNYFMPSMEIETTLENGTISVQDLVGGDRKTNPSYSLAGMLTKINYPTGGHTEFIFGPHRVKYPEACVDVIEQNIQLSATGGTGFNNQDRNFITDYIYGDPPTPDEIPDETAFFKTFKTGEICGRGTLAVGMSTTVQSVCDKGCGIVQIAKVSDPYTLIVNKKFAKAPTYIEAVVLEPNTSYYIFTRTFEDVNNSISVNLSWEDNDKALQDNYPVGGARIEQILDSNGGVKVFKYAEQDLTDDDHLYSNGVLLSIPVNHYETYTYVKRDAGEPNSDGYFCYMTPVPTMTRTSSSINNFSTVNGSHVGYTSVETHYLNNGKTVQTFNMPMDIEGDYDYPDIPFVSLANQRGHLLTEETYNEADELIKSVENTYNFGTTNTVGTTKAFRVVPYYGNYAARFSCTPPVGVPDMVGGLYELDKCFRYQEYRTPSYDIRLESTTTKTYSESGTQPMEVVTNYTYDPAYLNITAQSVNITGGQNINTTYQYPQDFTDATSIEMVNRGMTGVPIETQQQSNGVLIGGTKTMYTTNQGNIVPQRFYQVLNSNFVLAGQATHWNIDGKMTQYKKAKTDASLYTDPVVLNWSNDLLTSKTYKDLTSSYTYYPNRQLESITDENGLTTTYEYDGLQRLDKILAPADQGRTIETDFAYFYQSSTSSNEVKTTISFQDGSPTQSSSQFFDGLGRSTYSMNWNYSTLGTDVETQRVTYDNLSRPITSKQLGAEETLTTVYENSPLSRVLQTISPTIGTTTTSYGTNTQTITVTPSFSFAPNTLNKVVVTDVNGHQTETYTDLLGRTILVRKFDDNNNFVETKYEYNTKNQLTKVHRPDGEQYEYFYNNRGLLKKKVIPQSGQTRYYYDTKDRLVVTWNSNGHKIVNEYDDYDRPTVVGTFTGALPSSTNDPVINVPSVAKALTITEYVPNKTWIDKTYTNVLGTTTMLETDLDYDAIGRVINTTTQNHLGGTNSVATTYTDMNNPLTENLAVNSSLGTYTQSTSMEYGSYAQRLKKTMLNGKELSHLIYDNHDRLLQKQVHLVDPSSDIYLQTLDFSYDHAGRMTALNDLDAITSDLATCNEPVLCDYELRIPLSNTSNPSFTITSLHLGHKEVDLTGFPYVVDTNGDDGLGAELELWLFNEGIIYDEIQIQIETAANGTDKELLFEVLWEGEELFSHLTGSEDGNNPSQYDFERKNCCDKASGENDLFAMALQYQGTNINKVTWQTICNDKQYYDITYDALDRITAANHTTVQRQTGGGTTNVLGRYDMSIGSYTSVGDINALTRKGMTGLDASGMPTFGTIDQLTYGYNSNGQLGSVAEAATGSGATKGQKGSSNYTYDAMGNLKTDSQKGISNIQYNYLNLPRVITITGKGTIEFLYDAAGIKLKKTVKDESGTIITTKDYLGGVEYTDGQLEAVYHSEGRLTPKADGSYQYEYNIKDHLGNTRVTFADLDENGLVDKGEILQQNHYYPFGMNMEGEWLQRVNGKVTQYQYNGKELNTDFDINLNDYGARWYDSAIARWTTVDPLAEDYMSFSGYNYVLNNPLNYIDPDGRIVGDPPRTKGSSSMVAHRNSQDETTIAMNRNSTTTYTNDNNQEVIVTRSSASVLNTNDKGDVLGFYSKWNKTTTVDGEIDESRSESGQSTDFESAGDAELKKTVRIIKGMFNAGTTDSDFPVTNIVSEANKLNSKNQDQSLMFGKGAVSGAAAILNIDPRIRGVMTILMGAIGGDKSINFNSTAVLAHSYMDTGGAKYKQGEVNFRYRDGGPVNIQSGAIYSKIFKEHEIKR